MIRRTFASALLAAFGLAAVPAFAQQNVTKFVVPFPPGGGTDQYVRLLAADLTKKGMQVVVENKPGASGIIAADYVARAKPDGQTILMSSLGVLASNTVMYDKLPYNPQKDFAPV